MFTTRNSWIVVLLFVLVGLAISTCAHADVHVTAGIGRSHFTPSVNGVWYQNGYDFTTEQNDTAFRLGVADDLTRYVSLEGWGQYFGRSQIFASWESDGAYLEQHRLGQDPTTYGFTTVWLEGLGAGPVFKYPMRYLTPYLKTGLWWSRWKFDGHFSNPEDPRATTLSRWSCNQSSVDAYYGLGVERGRFSLDVVRYKISNASHNGNGCWANTDGVSTLMLGYRF